MGKQKTPIVPRDGIKKSIVFLSALDFKERSIQVIRKTPEHFVKSGWDVTYIVARDPSNSGDYFYESVINPDGISVLRFDAPFTQAMNLLENRHAKIALNKIRNYAIILLLAWHGAKLLRRNSVAVVYGYEVHGVLAAKILQLFGLTKGSKLVSRFQGTHLYHYLRTRVYHRLATHWEDALAMWLPSDLFIMTNDGTQGDKALELLRSRGRRNMRFWVNGVDEQKLPMDKRERLRDELGVEASLTMFLTVCRLVGWKRVERGLKALHHLVHDHGIRNVTYFIVGDGPERERLAQLASELDLDNHVVFTGSVPNSEVKLYLNASDYVILTYDSSNVGNPLLESIRANKIIFTLNNGDTSSWIEHGVNGFIYGIDDELARKMAADMAEILGDPESKQNLLEGVRQTERARLWTWDERLTAEVDEVERLISGV